MLRIRIHAQLRCKKHPRFNPALEGQSGVKGGCAGCETLLGLNVVANELWDRLSERRHDELLEVLEAKR
jgi:hypothetical protein